MSSACRTRILIALASAFLGLSACKPTAGADGDVYASTTLTIDKAEYAERLHGF
ncbi:MAG: hypothetical protein JJ910_05675, partial [Maricaulis sp.]|nr:hypothetical protein [Maricaulis sp.]